MRIALITEGTYPYATGGVSVWCDQLVRTLSADTFDIYAISGSGTEKVAWEFPANVDRFVPIPLWSARPIPDASRKIRRRVGPAFERLLGTLGDEGNHHAFADSLRVLAQFERKGELSRALTTADAVSMVLDFLGQLHGSRPTPDGVVPRPTVGDAVEVLRQLEHMFRAFAVSPPRAEVNHCVTGGLGSLVALAGKWENDTPLLLGEHGLYLRERYLSLKPGVYSHHVRSLLLRFVLRLTQLSYDLADYIVPVCQYNGTWEQAVAGRTEKIRTVYNGIEVSRFGTPPPEPDEPTLVWVGRIDPLKDVETLISGFALVRDAIPNARLRIFGPPVEAEYSERCHKLAADLGVTDSAIFEGRLAPDAVAGAYHGGQVVLLTSISEGFPYAVLEAMAAGRPVVATDVGGVGEALNGAGLLVPPRNPAAVAEACISLLTDDTLRRNLGLVARERVLSTFTLATSAEKYRDVYLDLSGGEPRALFPDRAGDKGDLVGAMATVSPMVSYDDEALDAVDLLAEEAS